MLDSRCCRFFVLALAWLHLLCAASCQMDDGFGDDDDVENLTASREREKRENFKKGVTEYPDVPDHDHERNPFRPQGADLGLSSGIDE